MKYYTINKFSKMLGVTPQTLTMYIETLEGVHRADPGDWIITGVKGEQYPCKPDIFDKTYERAEE